MQSYIMGINKGKYSATVKDIPRRINTSQDPELQRILDLSFSLMLNGFEMLMCGE